MFVFGEKKKSQSAPRGTKQLNFCWETEHKAINIWLVALILNNCVKAIQAICRELNTSNVGLESHYQTGMGWRWDCVKKCLLNTLPDYVSIQRNRCPNGETLHYGNLDQDQARLWRCSSVGASKPVNNEWTDVTE